MKKSLLTLLSIVPMLTFAQAEGSSSSLGGLYIFFIAIAISIIMFLVLRQVVLWYWKVETVLKKQDEQTKLLRSIYNSMEENNRLTQAQIELINGRGADDK